MDIYTKLRAHISEAVNVCCDEATADFVLEHPSDLSHGHYSANVALVVSKIAGKNPRELADEMLKQLESSIQAGELAPYVDRIEIAGPGFINFFLTPKFFTESINTIIDQSTLYGTNDTLNGQRIMVEYTDPNPFKQFHIGHLMNNTIGESVARLAEANGAMVVRACYQGDIGPHVAKCVWGMMKHKSAFPHDDDSLSDKVKFLGDAYTYGANQYKDDPQAREEIDALNVQIYKYISGDKEAYDEDIDVMYTKGRAWSLEHFEEIYSDLGTSFDHYFFETEVFGRGQDIVRKELEKGIFKESEGAVIFAGEDFGLHTRVFISSKNTPTYEAKELGLAFTKEEVDPCDVSIVVTASEQTQYFKVVHKAIEQFAPDIAHKTRHVEHGMMRFAEGKMSSRLGNVVTGEELLVAIKEASLEKMQGRDMTQDEMKPIATDVAVAAIKYSVLKNSPGKDIIFDRDKALATDGDSGPYIQYATVRAGAVLKKASEAGIVAGEARASWQPTELEQKLYQFPEVVARAYTERAPQHLVLFITEIASLFNSFYATHHIADPSDEDAPYKYAITKAVHTVLTNGLTFIGIRVPEKM